MTGKHSTFNRDKPLENILTQQHRQQEKRSIWFLLKEDIGCVFERDPAARNRMEVMLTYPGVHALVAHRFAHALWRRKFRFMARFIAYLSRIWTSIDIHPGASIGRRFFIDHGAGVVIGETAEIGNDVTLYHGVTLGGTSWSQGKRHPTLEHGVVVGAGAKILGPITLGANAKVGANSVVIKNVPAHKTVVGIPAKVVQSKEQGTLNPYGVDLNHHLIPDPVAGAISCLLDRIRHLELELGKVGCIPGGEQLDDECYDCEARDVCDDPIDTPKKQLLKETVIEDARA